MSYSGNPADSSVDLVRFLTGDTNDANEQLSDDEITAMLASASDDPQLAAIYCVEGLVAKYAGKADKSVGDLSISYSQISKGYKELVASLRSRMSVSSAPMPYAAGLSISEKEATKRNTDRVTPAFEIGHFDNKGQSPSGKDI